MLTMLRKLDQEQTPRDYSLAGIDLGGPRTRVLARAVCYNSTLTTLHLARKNIQDMDGIELARMLFNNTTLRKLELEGNNLSTKSAKEFGIALRHNTTLKFLDLESNQLTADGEDNNGLQVFIDALKNNKNLISLNLGNNKIDDSTGGLLKQCIEINTTLIDFEFGFNNISLNDVSRVDFLYNHVPVFSNVKSKSTSAETNRNTTRHASKNGRKESR